jgi:hypothetical protein
MEQKFSHTPHEDNQEKSGVRDALIRGQSTNPALQRLQRRVLEGTNPGEVITSYDRMHHRHSRS